MMNPNYSDVSPHQTLVAMGHTHPYSKREHSFTDVPFSGGDLAFHVYERQRLNLVQSGQSIFGSARTKEFDDLVTARDKDGQARDEDGLDDLFEEMKQHWKVIYEGGKGNLRENAEAATRATSERYHLLYYKGQNGKLAKVDTSPKHRHNSPNEHAQHPNH